ncbi:MAG: hypothetical protein KVP17_004479 [Porospora cf. gigantea B]|uniref:uncharacterized protein n=2 Tax=Porospora cf. gigantea B TaxID=2853592 RepID=UPI003571CB47|nr:MAG: hypothetical protein KVP17_004479 [Porospora cf. gigantea B]
MSGPIRAARKTERGGPSPYPAQSKQETDDLENDKDVLQMVELIEMARSMTLDDKTERPEFEKAKSKGRKAFHMIRVTTPVHKVSALKKNWNDIVEPLVTHMKLQVRFNTKRKCVEIRTSPETSDENNLQRGADFVKSFLLGFDVHDGLALLRLEDLFIQTFEIKDVKFSLKGDHYARAIGRMVGKDGQTKHAIENATRTRLVITEQHIHILGAFTNIILARRALCSLILGRPPSKVYNHLKVVTRRMKERM